MPSKDPEKRKAQARVRYAKSPGKQKAASRERYYADIEKSRGYNRARKNKYDASAGGKAKRREYRREIAGAKGKAYRTAEERDQAKRKRMAVLEAKREARKAAGPKENAWIKRLREELPELYDADASAAALLWRARYHLDPAFRAHEIERTAKRDARRLLLDDGSLTPEVVRGLFSRKVCPYCGKKMAANDKTLDHITPRHLGGWHSARNAVVCCYGCNSRKQARTPEAWIKMVPIDRQGAVVALWDRVTGAGVRQMWLAT